jgi:hypothetical protein
VRVVNRRQESFDVYIGRGSKWGNPFTHLPVGQTQAQVQCKTREESIARYRAYVMTNDRLMASLPELKGKTLGCYCKPQSCHGDVLVELVECFVKS